MFKRSKKPSKKIINEFKKGKLEFQNKDYIYSAFSDYYDEIMSSIDYESWFQYIQEILKRFEVNPSKVLDLACGTAPTLVYFSMNGYDAQGVDLSPRMIEHAREKYARMNLTSKLHVGDMTNFVSNETFQLIYLLNDSVNYLMKLEELSKFFNTSYNLLDEGGLLVFDASTELNITRNFVGTIYKEYETFSFLWNNHYIKDTRTVVSFLDFLPYDTLKVLREIHFQGIFTEEQVLEGALKAGFTEVHAFDGFTFDKTHAESEILHFVMRK